MTRKLALLLPVLLLVACATPEKAPAPTVDTPAPVAPAVATIAVPKSSKPGPIPVRPINVKAECAFRDETGYNGALKLDVVEAQVNAFEAKVNIPRRGACRFDLKQFRQTRDLPAIELTQLNGGRCIVRVWEQGERVTVAFQQCEKMCSGNSYPYLWPILNDRRDGSCA